MFERGELHNLGAAPQPENSKKSKHFRGKYDRIGARETSEERPKGLH